MLSLCPKLGQNYTILDLHLMMGNLTTGPSIRVDGMLNLAILNSMDPLEQTNTAELLDQGAVLHRLHAS